MKIISEYILRELGRYFSLFLGLFMFIYLLIDVLDRVDNFIEYKSTMAEIGLYFLCKLPMIVLQMSAVSLMLSVIVTLCLLNRHNEFTALKASGISAFRLTLPLVLIGLFISLVNFTLSEGVIPKASSRAWELWNYEMRHNKPKHTLYKRFKGWYRSEGAIYHIRRLQQPENILHGVALFFFDHDFNLNRRVYAHRAEHDKEGWTFIDGLDKTIFQGGLFKTERFDRRRILIPEKGRDFAYIERGADQMSLAQLDRHIQQLSQEGYETRPYKVDRQLKFAMPFVSAILTLLAVGLTLRHRHDDSIARVIAEGVAVAFAYLVVVGISRSLGQSGALPILIAVWLPNIFFALIGAYWLVTIRQ